MKTLIFAWTVLALAAQGAVPPDGRIKGPFIIASTPYREDGSVDNDALVREVRYMDAAGCTGVAWYESFPDTEGTWKAMVDVNREAQSIKDAILSEEICGAATADVGLDKVRVLTRRQGAKWTLVTCNIDANPLPSVTFTLPSDAPRTGTVEVLFENRTLPIRNGRFTDAYPGHDRHVYVIKEVP